MTPDARTSRGAGRTDACRPSRPAPRLFLNRIAELDWLIALEFGRVDEGQPPECWRGVSEQFGYLQDSPGGRVVGFKVLDFSRFDAEDPALLAIWSGPRFDVPALGLVDVTAGDVVVSARAFLGDASTINRAHLDSAIDAEGERAVALWSACLQAGDSMAHYGLGIALHGVGEYHHAYRHLRHYTEIAPRCSWAWCWYGRAAAALGEHAEARVAWRHAIALEDEGEEATDARELLEGFDA